MANICTIRILNEVYCVLVGLHPDHIGYFYEKYGKRTANHFFNPKFKLGSWDGKIRYFHKTGKTYVALLDEIIPSVIGLGYKIRLDDLRTAIRVDPDPIDKDFFSYVKGPSGESWEMRPYQVEMVNVLVKEGGGIGIAGTGAGKTSVSAAIAKIYEDTANFRSIIIVPDKNLTDQTYRRYEQFGLDVGTYYGDRKDINHKHIVSTWQSLQNNKHFIQEFQVIIVDEAHGLRGNVLTELLNEYGKDIPYRFGVTGTLPKGESDELAVRVAVGSVKYSIPAHVLQKQGYLADLDITVIQHKIDLQLQYQDYLHELPPLDKPLTYAKFRDTYFPDFTAEKTFLQNFDQRTKWIADYIIAKHELGKGNVLCLVNGVRFGKKLADKIPGAIFLSGKDSMEERREVYDRFTHQNNLTVIATVQIASTGLDIPRIFNMISVDLGKSFVRTIQSIGRGLRKAHDKDSVHYTDICCDLKYSKRHLTERKKYYREANYPFKVKPTPL